MPGLSAEIASGGQQVDSGHVLAKVKEGEEEEEEEEENSSAPVGMTIDAVEQTSGEVAEALLWQQGSTFGLMMHL